LPAIQTLLIKIMGCFESTTMLDHEIEFHREKKLNYNAVFVTRELEENDDEIILDERALVDDNQANPILFTTSKNDIRPASKSEIEEQGALISRQAIRKLTERKKLEAEVQKIQFNKDKLNRRLSKQLTNPKAEE
jgi:hypothetical protein